VRLVVYYLKVLEKARAKILYVVCNLYFVCYKAF